MCALFRKKAPPPPPPARTLSYNQLTSCPDFEPAFVELLPKAQPFTMTSIERMYGLYKAMEHVVRQNVPGDFVECGVWKGGSAMLAALALKQLGDTSRRLWLYDTFEGMTPPSDRDVDFAGKPAADHLATRNMKPSQWCRSELDEVRSNMASTGYPLERITYVAGRVEATIPEQAPDRIAVLRLDTDWYDSTMHELVHLYPRLSPGGVLIVDDYGHWRGCREAVDRYFAEQRVNMLLARLDYTGRMGVKGTA